MDNIYILKYLFQKYHENNMVVIICPDTDVGHYQITHMIYLLQKRNNNAIQ